MYITFHCWLSLNITYCPLLSAILDQVLIMNFFNYSFKVAIRRAQKWFTSKNVSCLKENKWTGQITSNFLSLLYSTKNFSYFSFINDPFYSCMHVLHNSPTSSYFYIYVYIPFLYWWILIDGNFIGLIHWV